MTRTVGAALAALAACRGSAAVPVGARVGPALAAALTAAETAREPWRCAAQSGPGATDETHASAGRTWQFSGHTMRLAMDVTPDERAADRSSGELTIGVLADAAGNAPATLAAIRRIRDKLGHVDLVLTLGGMGSTAPELNAVFAALADGAAWPVVALPGDLEAVPALREAIAAARERGAAVYDGRLIHDIELPGATIALVRGAGAASRLVAGADGCLYQAADASRVLAALTRRAGLRIIASAEAPRSDGDPATGDLAITATAGHEIDVALHGAARGAASAARSGGRDAAAADITPGVCDATPRLSSAGTTATAGVLAVRGTTWRWQPIDDR